MSTWKLGEMLVNDQGLKKGDKVAVKRNDDLAKYFLTPNFAVFRPKAERALFYTREAIPHYVKLLGNLSDHQLSKVEDAWPAEAKQLRLLWKRNKESE